MLVVTTTWMVMVMEQQVLGMAAKSLPLSESALSQQLAQLCPSHLNIH